MHLIPRTSCGITGIIPDYASIRLFPLRHKPPPFRRSFHFIPSHLMTDTDLRRARYSLHLTQAELGLRVNRCARQIVRYEHAEVMVPEEVAQAVRSLLTQAT